VKPGVGYVDMTRGFNLATAAELDDALGRLHARGVNSVILDLRRNPGGFLDQAIQVAETFLPIGQLILSQKGRNGQRDASYDSRNSNPDLIPLVILINAQTASASEIVAGAMQDHDRALIVGETSFGKGLVQSIIPLEYGTGLTLTTAKYFTPSGRLIQRDYSNGSLYDYYKHDDSTVLDRKDTTPKRYGPEKRTDAGRTVYGGGGITPDELVPSDNITVPQQRLFNPLFAFARELTGGRISGFESYRISQIDFRHELQQPDYLVNDRLLKSFDTFVASDPALKSLGPSVARNRSFVELYLRFYLVTAAYGRTMADRVLVTTDDTQMARAFEVLPRARDLAMATGRRRAQP
jgi:carboxyl-terminal processing protease